MSGDSLINSTTLHYSHYTTYTPYKIMGCKEEQYKLSFLKITVLLTLTHTLLTYMVCKEDAIQLSYGMEGRVKQYMGDRGAR